jgi:peptide/nickel transport system substrate-binding protein
MGDWSKGLAGSGETDWQNGYLGSISLETGCLAESWEMPDATTIIYHLRHGVHYYVQPGNAASALVNGREMTADDVVWSQKREWTSPASFPYTQYPADQRPISFTATDKYTVEIKVPAISQGPMLFMTGDQLHIYPPEPVAKYGSYDDWHNQVGTGPFWLQDYVAGSSLTYIRNPNYFMFDPIHPENRLPYVDVCKQLIIVDKATSLSALRTGKIDASVGGSLLLTWEDKEQLLKNSPQLKSYQIAGTDNQIWGRCDKQNLPFKDVRVRQALTLAIDQQTIAKDFYSGSADLLGHPFPPYKAWKELYTPLDQMPPAVQELFTHNAAKAKQLLAEAGYPEGFTCQIICGSTEDADFLSMIKQQLAAVNVNLEIKLMENAVYRSVVRARSYDQMLYGGSPTAAFPWKMRSTDPLSLDNKAYYQNKVTDDAFAAAAPFVAKDDAKWHKIVKDTTPFILEQCVGIWLPVPWGFKMWWPWLQNYHGEGAIGYDNQMVVAWYVWIDQSMKTSMGH